MRTYPELVPPCVDCIRTGFLKPLVIFHRAVELRAVVERLQEMRGNFPAARKVIRGLNIMVIRKKVIAMVIIRYRSISFFLMNRMSTLSNMKYFFIFSNLTGKSGLKFGLILNSVHSIERSFIPANNHRHTDRCVNCTKAGWVAPSPV